MEAKMLELKKLGKGEEEDCIKAWLRAKYADSIRENKKGAEPEDFDLIGGSFHKWVRDEHTRLGLASPKTSRVSSRSFASSPTSIWRSRLLR